MSCLTPEAMHNQSALAYSYKCNQPILSIFHLFRIKKTLVVVQQNKRCSNKNNTAS